jgi:serine/threonine protein kinase
MWMAPEILKPWMNNTSTNDLPHGTIQSDTFAAGCVFFYVATRGRHPFEQPTEISKQNTDGNILANILINKPVEFNKRNQSKYFIVSA